MRKDVSPIDSPPGEPASPPARAPKSQPHRTPSARRPIYSDSSDSEVDLWDAPASEMLRGTPVSGGRKGSDRRGTSTTKRAPPSSRRGMARRRVGDSPGGSTSTGSRSSLSDTNDDARESSHPSVARAVERAAASLAVHPDAAYETFRASVLKSSLKLRSARARGGGSEAVGASDEASKTDFSSGDEKKRESFLAPLRARLADTAAFERPSPSAPFENTNDENTNDASSEPVVRNPPRDVDGGDEKRETERRDGDARGDETPSTSSRRSDVRAAKPRSEEDDARYQTNNIAGVEVEVSSTVSTRDVARDVDRDESPESRSRRSTPPPRRRSFESSRARSADSRDRRRRREQPHVSLDAPTSAALGDGDGAAATSAGPGPSPPASRRRSASRVARSERTPPRGSPGGVSLSGATGGGSRGLSARPRLAIRDSDLASSPFLDDGVDRAFGETDLVVSDPQNAALLERVERLEAERDALRKSVEKLERKKKERGREKSRRAIRDGFLVSSDAAPVSLVATERRERDTKNDANEGGGLAEYGHTRNAYEHTVRARFRLACTRLFGVSAFVAMAAALVIAAVDIFDIVDPAAPIGATEHSGRLTHQNVDNRPYWELDTGPTGRAARSILKLPKEVFVNAVAEIKNALFSAWVTGHARESDGAFEYDDPTPAPS